MMGIHHAQTGAIAGVATLPVVTALLHPDISGMGLYVIVTTGAALLPDIDHPDSTISRVGGPFTRVFAWLLAKLCGGHRKGMHSYWGLGNVAMLTAVGAALTMHAPLDLAFGGAAWILLTLIGAVHGAADRARGWEHGKPRDSVRSTRSARSTTTRRSTSKRSRRSKKPDPVTTVIRGFVYLILLGALAMACMLGGQTAGQWIIGIIMALTMSAAVRLLKIRGWLDDILPTLLTIWLLSDHVDVTTVPVAVTVGALVHVYGDMLTEGGCPVGWPGSQRMISFGLFKTNGPFEKEVLGKILIVALIATTALVSVYMAP